MRHSVSNRLLELIAIFFIVLTAMFFTSPKLTSQYLHRPQGSVFVGMTAYFEDFYYYLDQFYQGGHGNWLTENRFSIEHFPSTLIYVNNIIFGKIGGIFGLESFQSYNLFGALFKFLFMISAYVMIRYFFPTSLFKRLSVYLIFLFSTSLPNLVIKNGTVMLNPSVDLFKTENRILSRFATSPNGMFTSFLFIGLFLILIRFFFRKYPRSDDHVSSLNESPYPHWNKLIKIFIIILPVYILFTFGDLSLAIVLLSLFIILYLKYSLKEKSFLFLSDTKVLMMTLISAFILIFLYIYRTVNSDLVYLQATQWDNAQYLRQIKAIGIVNFIGGFGLQMPLFFYGYWLLIRKHHKTVLEESALILTAICVLGYILPIIFQISIPGYGFLFAASYVPIAIIVWGAIEELSNKFHRRNMTVMLLAVYLVINFLSFFPGWYEEFKPLKEPDYHFAYIPNELYQGLVFLRTAEPRDGNVLASPRTSIDLMIPGIAGRYSYSGHFLTTYNSKVKDELASKFFFEWTNNTETHDFLKKNNIRFIVVTKYSASLQAFKIYYPFLKIVFENPTVTIFRYDPV